MKKWVKILLSVSVSIIVLLIFSSFYFYYIINKSLPDYSGEITLEGINNEVSIYRDENAVPYIIADREDDAIFALGYLQAQERLFQMDLIRRAGEGRLSEIFGNRTVPFDQMFRTLGIKTLSEESYNQLHTESKKMLESYSAGVNAFIGESWYDLSIEFDLLGYHPDEWKPVHSIMISKLLAFSLNFNWWTDISFAHLVQKFGPAKASEIIPNFNENQPLIVDSDYKNFASIGLDILELNRDFKNFMGFTGTHIGSNNWIVNGQKSESGLPIIANDPHLPLQAPGIWYFASIKSDNLNCDGFTIPGAPGIIIGKNENIAWAVTNVMADDSDLYIERVNEDEDKYFFNGAWRNLTIINDTISVKDSADVVYQIKKTHRGPVISDVHPYCILYPTTEKNASLSMRWTAFETSDELFAFSSINKAKDWTEFKEALKHFKTPGQNFIYGDKEGNIGYICAARLPIRYNLNPSFVYDGTTDKYDWKGFVPYSSMPKLFNPKENFIATANNKVIEDFPHHISNIWEPPSRIERITELLKSKEKHSTADYKKYQNDIFSHYNKKIQPHILDAFKGVEINDNNLKLAIDLISKWDFLMNKESQVPTIFSVFFQKLLENIFMDEMGENLFREYVFIANVPHRIITELLEKGYSKWFDDVNTEVVERKNDIIRKSFVDALEFLENELGSDLTYWQWGDIHTITMRHLFSGKSSLLDKLVDIGPYGIGGDGTTIFNTEHSFNKPYKTHLGPSMRFIFDFAEPDIIQLILPTGQSGHFLSRHYNNMTQKWIDGKYLKLNTNKDYILNSNYGLLRLLPE